MNLIAEAHGNGRERCLTCKTPFAEIPPTPVGEKAVRRGEDDWARPQGRKRRRSANGQANGHDEEDELEDELEPEEGMSQEPSASLEQRAVDREEDELERDSEPVRAVCIAGS